MDAGQVSVDSPTNWNRVSGGLDAEMEIVTYEHSDGELRGHVIEQNLKYQSFIVDSEKSYVVYPEEFAEVKPAVERLHQRMGNCVREAACPDCGHDLSDEDKRAGSAHPEIGWEYYTCSSCDARSHPSRVEGEESPMEKLQESPTEFTGVVVSAETPILVADNETVVQCRGLTSTPRMDDELTVVGVKRPRSVIDHEEADFVLWGTRIKVEQWGKTRLLS